MLPATGRISFGVLITLCATQMLAQERKNLFLHSPPLCSRGGEGWGYDCIHTDREPGQAGKVETRAVDNLTTSFQLFLAFLCLVL